MSKLQGAISQVTTAAIDFASLGAVAQDVSETVTVTGAAVGDLVIVNPASPLTAGLSIDGYVSAADTVTLVLTNASAGALDAASTVFYVAVIH